MSTYFPAICKALSVPEPVGKGWSRGREFVPRSQCRQCGERFYAPPSQRRRGGGIFCSKPCRGAWQRSQKVPNVVCRCGVRFHRPISHIRGRESFCSKTCADNARLLARLTHCVTCGVPLVEKPRAARYCSLRCRPPNNPPRPRPFAICGVCGLIFSPPAGSTGRYCSMACVGRTRVGPRSVGEIYSKTRGGRRADLGNKYFRSAWEANWARYLNWLQSLGEVLSWQFEPETFEFHKIRRGSRLYTPDFKVTNKDGSVEYHEIKGYMDPRSATKIRRMAKYYPLVKLIVIEKAAYRSVADKVSGLIEHWEYGTVRK